MRTHDDFSPDTPNVVNDAEANLASPVDRLVKSYRAAGKRTAEEILEQCCILVQAHEELPDDELISFYRQIRLKPDGSTSRKLRKIGAMKDRFEPYTDRLPSAWTTWWELTRLSTDQFLRLADDGILHPHVTLQEIHAHFAAPSVSASIEPSEGTSPKAQLWAFDFNLVAATKRSAFAKRLKCVFEEFEVPLGDEQYATLDAFIGQEAAGGQDVA